MGGEQNLSLYNNILGIGFFGFMAVMNLDWHWAVGMVFFAGPVQSLIRRMAKIDPQYGAISAVALRQWTIHEPHGFADIRGKGPKQLITR